MNDRYESFVNAMVLTALGMVESVQFLIILALIYSFVPIFPADFIKELPVKLQKGIQPEREIFFYHWFLFFAVAGQIALVLWLRHRKKDFPREALTRVTVTDALLVFVELYAVFKIWQYDDPWWARALLYGGIGAWVLVRIFWDECQWVKKITSEVMMEKRKVFRRYIDGFIPVLLIACLWAADTQKVLGRVFGWDQFRNWDALIMLPGWAYVHGQGLNTDIISSWGMGAVVFISRCSQVLGGFDYAHVLVVMMGMVIIYYGLLYAFLRVWLRSVLLAVALIAVAVKIQMFHTGISPLIWIFPQDTPVRHWLDLGVLWCLWQHTRSSQRKYLTGAAFCTGLALAWSLSAGLSLLTAFWGYLIFLLVIAEHRLLTLWGFKEIRRSCLYGFMPLALMALILFLLQGPAVFHASFWKNMAEPLQLFLQGVGTLSFYTCLYDRHFFAFIAGFVIPVIYVWTLIIVANLVYAKKLPREDVFLVPLCIYGLVLYTHYLAHASISHYYAVGVPVVLVIGFWISKLMPWFAQAHKVTILLGTAIACWGALFTNIFFVYYPNILDISRMDWKPETSFYRSQFKFDQDAAMIARLTPNTKGAAVISSFETQLLMQANRKPFFYYAPLVSSERMDINTIAGTSLITQQRLDKTINQITGKSPEYIFIEKKLLGQWPPQLVRYYPGLAGVLSFISEHYVLQEQGQYLVAMHLK